MNYANFSGKKLRQVAYFCHFAQKAVFLCDGQIQIDVFWVLLS